MSSCFIRLLTPAGLESVPYRAASLADAARFEPADGVYTVTNTIHTFEVVRLDAHLDRLEDSARRASIPLRLDRSRLRAALRQMIAEAAFGDVRFRVTVPRGHPDHLILSLEPFAPPSAAVYEQGVACVTLPDSARQQPEAKTTGWMLDRERYTLPEGVYTGLLLNAAGEILEGVSSNFYALLDGKLRTAGSGVLPGIARQIVFDIAPNIISLNTQAVTVRDLPRISEAFITSSSRGIVPVVRIDDIPLGAGVPGPVTRALRQAYQSWVDAHLEPL